MNNRSALYVALVIDIANAYLLLRRIVTTARSFRK